MAVRVADRTQRSTSAMGAPPSRFAPPPETIEASLHGQAALRHSVCSGPPTQALGRHGGVGARAPGGPGCLTVA